MSLTKPFHRNYRAIKKGPNSPYSGWAYIRDQEYALAPAHYVRSLLIIQNDLERLFEYIEPSPESLSAYSYRIHELLMRACIEIEANFKAILGENKYTPSTNKFGNPILDMNIYRKIDVTHHLSTYQITLPIWRGPRRVMAPFANWSNGTSPNWYRAYNASKHDRHDQFKQASFENLLDAVAGLLIVISSQFYTENFASGATLFSDSGDDYHEMEPSIGSIFRIQFPNDWIDDEMYDFDWSNLRTQSDRFAKIDFDNVVAGDRSSFR